MIDYFLRWPNEQAAKDDAARYRQHLGLTEGSPPVWRNWYLNHFLPNVRAWRISQDVMVGSPPRVQHTYLPGWFGILALDSIDTVVLNDGNLQFALNREFNLNISPPIPIVVKNNIGAVLQDVGVAPVFAGSRYPLGGL